MAYLTKSEFQFQTGSIKRLEQNWQEFVEFQTFQFQTGSIKSPVGAVP